MLSMGNVEIERKYSVDEATLLPSLHNLPGVRRIEQPVEHQLEAVYFDTEDLVLAARRMTLRRRAGGDDDGWHLKLPLGPDERREIHEPLGVDPEIVPEPLMQSVRVYVRTGTLAPVARLRTRRILHRLRSSEDHVLADVSDDHVQADRLGFEPAHLAWREWEIELVDGPAALLDAGQAMLAAVGIRPATYASKLARALGDRYPQEEPSAPPRPTRKSPAATALLSYLYEQVQVLTDQDPRVRQDASDSGHKMRISTRRLRSALATYRKLLDADVVSHLRGELKWLAGVLGPARDAQVMHQRLNDLVAAEPTELIIGPVSQRIDKQLGADFDAAHRKALDALNDERYFHLLDALDALLAAPPLTGLASEPAHKIVPDLIRKDWKRLRKAVNAAMRTPGGVAHETAMHDVRKSAKRLRYAAESAASVRGKRVVRLARSARRLQRILGDHQDSVVARDLLRRLGIEAHTRGENGFGYGRLHALEQAVATDSEARFLRAWKDFPSIKSV